MNTRIRKIIVAIGLTALCFSPAYAGSFSQNVTSGAGSGVWGGTVNVPSVGYCTQYLYGGNDYSPGGFLTSDYRIIPQQGGGYWYEVEGLYYKPEQQASMVSVSGPLGSFFILGKKTLLEQDPIPPGTYNIFLSVQNGGTAVVGISW